MFRLCTIALMMLVSCSETTVRYDLVSLDGTQASDAVAEQIIIPYRDSLNVRMNEVLVYASNDISRGKPDSPLGSLIADVIREEAQNEIESHGLEIDLCLLNIGGLRIDLSAGDITLGQVFELMPFENSICLVKLSPEAINAMLTYLVEVGGQPVSGMVIHVKDSAVVECLINGKALEQRDYWVATSDYLVEGGDKMYFLKDHTERIDLDLKIRDAIIRNFVGRGERDEHLIPPSDNRIIHLP